ncbi:PRLI-interacting factor K family protein [Populus alba x Populus x berolinensis]|uniref:PRLI-interacting factor K family protein n=1 Tax=Populus alba x Populus x berolinensis TaxID=444605 RepID=A0AAD6WDQ3_9ROSI|nr:PRLI-interacting factor K family protein [Populus alba x Populus x berolinensis]
MKNNMMEINQRWDEIIMPTDEEPLHENHEEDGKIIELKSTNAIKSERGVRERKERKERAKLKLERERKAKEEAIKQREAIEAVHRCRSLDAIHAHLKVDEQMLENLLGGRGIVFPSILEAVSFQGSGDKIKIPPSCFTELSDQAEEGSGGLPHVWSNLFPLDSPKAPLIEVRYVWLPKGTYAKLEPDVFGFSNLPNHKAVLETSLQQHMKVFHKSLQCPCGVVLEKEQMVQHQASISPHRLLITCWFCGDMVQSGTLATDVCYRLSGLTENEGVCGSKTAPRDAPAGGL